MAQGKRNMLRDKRIRALLRVLFFAVALVLPVVLVIIEYEFITEFNGYKAGTAFLMVMVVVLYRFRDGVIKWIDKWEYSFLKHVILAVNRVIIPLIIWAVLIIVQNELNSIIFIVRWIAITSILGFGVIMPLEQRYDHFIKRELRKQEMREVRDE